MITFMIYSVSPIITVAVVVVTIQPMLLTGWRINGTPLMIAHARRPTPAESYQTLHTTYFIEEEVKLT